MFFLSINDPNFQTLGSQVNYVINNKYNENNFIILRLLDTFNKIEQVSLIVVDLSVWKFPLLDLTFSLFHYYQRFVITRPGSAVRFQSAIRLQDRLCYFTLFSQKRYYAVGGRLFLRVIANAAHLRYSPQRVENILWIL